MTMRSEMEDLRLRQIERLISQIGSEVKGYRDFHAQRITDIMDQIDVLATELAEVKTTVEKARQAFSDLRKGA